LLSTIADLPSEYKCKIRLEIGGKGPYKSALEQQTKDLALDKIISFKGYIPEGEINDFYSRNDLFILCTREEKDNCNVEGFGLVFVEAQACGTAVIGTNAGGIPDAIKNGKGGWLIEQDSKTELSSILKKLVDDKGLAQRQCQIARARVLEECSQKNYINRLIRYIYDVAR
jgi:phosphatidylinositol alpha-1,6-mannosyltransferase